MMHAAGRCLRSYVGEKNKEISGLMLQVAGETRKRQIKTRQSCSGGFKPSLAIWLAFHSCYVNNKLDLQLEDLSSSRARSVASLVVIPGF